MHASKLVLELGPALKMKGAFTIQRGLREIYVLDFVMGSKFFPTTLLYAFISSNYTLIQMKIRIIPSRRPSDGETLACLLTCYDVK